MLKMAKNNCVSRTPAIKEVLFDKMEAVDLKVHPQMRTHNPYTPLLIIKQPCSFIINGLPICRFRLIKSVVNFCLSLVNVLCKLF